MSLLIKGAAKPLSFVRMFERRYLTTQYKEQ